jgi:uncharacterized membrane-anchored protein YitT (DUF2179 family)
MTPESILHRLGRRVLSQTRWGNLTRRTLFNMMLMNVQLAASVREIVRQADPDAFVVISPSNEVLGEGFKPLTRTRRVSSRATMPPTELDESDS